MALLYLDLPRLSVSLDVPDQLAAAFASNFSYAVTSRPSSAVGPAYRVDLIEHGAVLFKDDVPSRRFAGPADLIFALEEDIENAVIAGLGDWVGLHAGAAVARDTAIVVVGHPDTGKTSTTFQLAEMGLDLLCEEVAPIDPATGHVQPFPQILTLDRSYVEASISRYPVTRGRVSFPTPAMARYTAGTIRTRSAPLGVVLFPLFDPSQEPTLEEVSPGAILTDLLQYCFAPALGDERLYNNVIGLIGGSRLFRLRSNGIESSRALLRELIRVLE